MLLVGSNPVVSGAYKATHTLRTLLRFEWSGGTAEATNLDFNFTIAGAWYAQQVEIDSTAAINDWVRRRARLARAEGQLRIRGLNLEAGERISLPPDRELIHERFLNGEFDLKFLLMENFPLPTPVPELDQFIVPTDLELSLPELPPEAVTSST
jgi:hypothetical protein